MQSRIERRFANGWTVQGSYTYSKAMEAVDFLNPQDARRYESIAALDCTHHFTVDFAVGGWQLGGLYLRQTGAAWRR